MTPDFLEKYDCTLTVKNPVFVGSGKKLSKVEYIYEPGTKTLRVLDVRRLYEFMASKGREKALEDYFRRPDNYNGTIMFLLSNQIRRPDYDNFVAYTLEDCMLPQDSEAAAGAPNTTSWSSCRIHTGIRMSRGAPSRGC